jgi:hypothetical protein
VFGFRAKRQNHGFGNSHGFRTDVKMVAPMRRYQEVWREERFAARRPALNHARYIDDIVGKTKGDIVTRP